jgi:putative membrane protein
MADSIEESIGKKNGTTRLAADRTRLAYDRTLMAWIRTATSLITFGFTIYKFFQIEGGVVWQDRVLSATEFSVLMIVFGLLSLIIATLEHRRDLNALKAEYPDIPRSSARVLAGLISLLGILALVTVFLHR